MTKVSVRVEGIDKIRGALNRFPREITKSFRAAGKEAAGVLLLTRGLKAYPPETAANKPPEPYYIRGRGTQRKSGNDYRSENLGKRWRVSTKGAISTAISNTASYAKWVHGEDQARHMGAIGWRKLLEVAQEKIGDIQRIYEGWVARCIRTLGL